MNKIDLGPIGLNVAGSVRRFREARKFSYAELSRRLGQLGRPIPALGLRQLEAGNRRVDVDDLIALALVLNVSPLALLLPVDHDRLVAGGDKLQIDRIWMWAQGFESLTDLRDRDQKDRAIFIQDSNPIGPAPMVPADPHVLERYGTPRDRGERDSNDGDS